MKAKVSRKRTSSASVRMSMRSACTSTSTATVARTAGGTLNIGSERLCGRLICKENLLVCCGLVAELGCNNGGFKFAHGLPVAFRVGEHMAVPIVCHGYRCVTKYFLDPLRCPTQMRDKE